MQSQANRSRLAHNPFGDESIRTTKTRKKQNKKKQKLNFQERYSYISELPFTEIENWTIKISPAGFQIISWELKPNANGVKVYSIYGYNDYKRKVYGASWYYHDLKTNRIVVGSKKNKINLSEKNRFYNSNFIENVQSWNDIIDLVEKNLTCSLLLNK